MVNVGVIGTGSMGQNHVRIYSEIADLFGIADANEEVINNLSTKFNVKGYTDYHELLAEDELVAVSIATPTVSHLEVGMAALEAGKHVLIEKPLTIDPQDSTKLIQAAKNNNLVLAVGHVERHNPVVGFTKNLLGNNKFGELISASSRRVSSFPARIKDVGVILDLGIHDIDVLRYLVGKEVKSIYALAGTAGPNSDLKFEDHANILLEFEGPKGSIPGFIEVNWLTPMKVRKVSLTCSENFVELDYITQSLEVSASTVMEFDVGDLYHVPQKYDIRKITVKQEEPLKNELLDFLKAVETGSIPLVTGEDAFMTLKIAEASKESYTTGSKIEL
ncbi:MAG: Gfo/Idh/MocA family oxidoreductase [Thermoplasmata archaeon]|nr:Gfo/Idh/MocA family oxidoreductase [Thermoplasmata archaeon]